MYGFQHNVDYVGTKVNLDGSMALKCGVYIRIAKNKYDKGNKNINKKDFLSAILSDL